MDTLSNKLRDLAADQAEWSQQTFGSDAERGPIGALRHLACEAEEAEAAYESGDQKHLADELADCFLLILDASRRCGLTPEALIDASQRKMLVNRGRDWPEPEADRPVKHLR